jgi:hypothetical protein
MTTHPPTEWQEKVAPLVSKFRLAATFQSEVIFDADGAAAMALMLETMAKQLDRINQIIAREMSHV